MIYLSARFPRGSSRKITLFTMGTYGNLLKKFKLSCFHQMFCISALGISFYFKYMKTNIKSHQLVKFKRMLTS